MTAIGVRKKDDSNDHSSSFLDFVDSDLDFETYEFPAMKTLVKKLIDEIVQKISKEINDTVHLNSPSMDIYPEEDEVILNVDFGFDSDGWQWEFPMSELFDFSGLENSDGYIFRVAASVLNLVTEIFDKEENEIRPLLKQAVTLINRKLENTDSST